MQRIVIYVIKYSKPNIYIAYFDVNSLYAHAMKQPLPVGQLQMGYGSKCGQKIIFTQYFDSYHKSFKISISLDGILNAPDDADMGYVVEVDLEYPEYLHDALSDYLLACETMTIPKTWLSGYQLDLVNKFCGKYAECVKLVPNLCDKKKYIYIIEI